MRSKAALVTFLFVLVFSGCHRPSGDGEDGSPSRISNAPTPASLFERDMQYVRNSQFTYVWVFSRKDGKPLDRDDSAFLRTNAPQMVDWVTTDEGRKVIGGTHFDLAQGNLELLKKRFVVEDYSGK